MEKSKAAEQEHIYIYMIVNELKKQETEATPTAIQ